MRHSHLLSPGQIGSMTLRNRILMCPMGDNQATSGGYVTDQQIEYFEARARGGAALLLVGSVGVTAPDGLSSPRQSAIGDTSFVEGWRRLADRVHAHGGKVALQLVHNGKNAVEDIIAARPLLVPSLPESASAADPLMGMLTPVELENMGTPAQVKGAEVIFHEMTHDDIARMVESYALAVERAKAAGIDACELHAGHGYLIDNFLSPTTNHRNDEYGGTVEKRARFLVEVIEGIRARVGRDYPIWCRINGGEVLIEGETLEDACRVAKLTEAAGADAVHVSLYANPGSGVGYTQAHTTHTPGGMLPLAAEVKKHVGIPVITVGRLSPDDAEKALSEGKADFVAMGRKLLADPDLPNKLAAGEPDTVRPCMYHYRCISQIFVRSHVRCAVNATTGFESTRKLEPAAVSKRILVVGGGPAGMEAARLAALRGHEVQLVERATKLGGLFRLAAATAEPNAELLAWFEGEMDRRGVVVQLGSERSAEEIVQDGYDDVIVATGAEWARPSIPGAELDHVSSVDELSPWLDDDRGQEKGRSFVLLGGDKSGLGLAGVARARGAEVVVLEPTEVFAAANGLVGRWRYVHDAREAGIVLEGGAQVQSIDAKGVHWIDRDGEKQCSPADRVLICNGARPNPSLATALAALGVNAHSIGDCDSVGLVEGAMEGAAELVLSL
jgi:2,4-dienoyl-CoA reductase-like NADH-dependent reductase (Old Yellow Enzyme family)/thioredoxin reductase